MTNTPSVLVGANVRAEMARHGVSQMQLSAAIGLAQTSISARLRGRIPFDVEELERAAKALGVPVSAFFVGSEGAA